MFEIENKSEDKSQPGVLRASFTPLSRVRGMPCRPLSTKIGQALPQNNYMYICTYVRMYVCMYVCMYVRTYVRMHVCM